MDDYETCLNYCDRNAVFFSSNERLWIGRIHKLKAAHPEDVTILKEPEDNDGTIYCKVPFSWFRLSPPKKVEMSDERRAELSERMRAMNANRESQ